MSRISELTEHRFPPVEQAYGWKDTVLYALGVGLGQELDDPRRLDFVYEKSLLALPTMAVVLASDSLWPFDPALGLDWKQILHGEQSLEIHAPLPAQGRVVGQMRVVDVVDKGSAKGAFVLSENRLTDATSGQLVATLTSTAVCRGDGGFGGRSGPLPLPHVMPERDPDITWSFRTDDQAARLYRLSGDYNPLHVDPQVAETAGFDKPILHGLCTFGIAGHAILRSVCEYDSSRLRKMKVRFSNPVFPGETIRTDIWLDGDQVSFRCVVVERNVIAINNGLAMVAPQAERVAA